jgi:hypothetical protein
MCSGQAFFPTRLKRPKQNFAVGILRQFEHVHEVASASITMAVILSRADSSSVFTEDPACSTSKTDIRANRIRPKVCGAAAIVGVVSMMVRPNAMMRDDQDLTAENIETEAQNDVELLATNDLEVSGWVRAAPGSLSRRLWTRRDPSDPRAYLMFITWAKSGSRASRKTAAEDLNLQECRKPAMLEFAIGVN